MNRNVPLSEQWYEKAQDFVALDAAATILEEGKSAFLSQKMAALGDIAVSKAELQVKSSKEWSDYIKKMVKAREEANFAKIAMEFTRMVFQEVVSKEANARLEMKMTR